MKQYKNVIEEEFILQSLDLDIALEHKRYNWLPMALSTMFGIVLKLIWSLIVFLSGFLIISVILEMSGINAKTIDVGSEPIVRYGLTITCIYIICSWIDWIINRIYMFKIDKTIISRGISIDNINNERLSNFIVRYRDGFSFAPNRAVQWNGREFEFLLSSFLNPTANRHIKYKGIDKYSLDNIIWNILGVIAEVSISIYAFIQTVKWTTEMCPLSVRILIRCIFLILIVIMVIRNLFDWLNFLDNSYPRANSWVYGKHINGRVYMHPFKKFLIRFIRFFIPWPV